MLKALDGFRSEMGVKGEGLLQGEETELCERMSNKFGKGVIYNPEAIVYHNGKEEVIERVIQGFLSKVRLELFQAYFTNLPPKPQFSNPL